MRLLGFVDAAVSGAGADGGIDVRASDAAAQVKYRSTATGSPDVQRLLGAGIGSVTLLFYAFAGFSKTAIEVANRHGVALFRFTTGGGVYADNPSARRLMIQAGEDPARPSLVKGFTPESQSELLVSIANAHTATWTFDRAYSEFLDELESQVHGLNVRGLSWDDRHLLRQREESIFHPPTVSRERALVLEQLEAALSVAREVKLPDVTGKTHMRGFVWMIKDGDADKVERIAYQLIKREAYNLQRMARMPVEWADWFSSLWEYQWRAQGEADRDEALEVMWDELRFDTACRQEQQRQKEARARAQAARWRRR